MISFTETAPDQKIFGWFSIVLIYPWILWSRVTLRIALHSHFKLFLLIVVKNIGQRSVIVVCASEDGKRALDAFLHVILCPLPLSSSIAFNPFQLTPAIVATLANISTIWVFFSSSLQWDSPGSMYLQGQGPYNLNTYILAVSMFEGLDEPSFSACPWPFPTFNVRLASWLTSVNS